MKVGHVHLKVRDLQRSVAFYQRYLEMKVSERLEERLAFMTAGSAHHDLALQEVGERAATPGRHDIGLYHVAFEVHDRQSLAATFRKLKQDGVQVFPVDHRISWALYFNDPDGNGLEVYWDTRQTGQGSEIWEGVDRPLSETQLQ